METSRSLPIALLRAREKVMSPVREMLSTIGVTEQQWRVLRVLEEEGATGPTELAERSALLLPSLTRILQGLETRGLIERHVVARDRRRQKIAASPAGLTLVRNNLDEAKRIGSHARNVLGAERHDLLLDLLNEVASANIHLNKN
jgi:homoprotocatechuate degradation regulator HpaR